MSLIIDLWVRLRSKRTDILVSHEVTFKKRPEKQSNKKKKQITTTKKKPHQKPFKDIRLGILSQQQKGEFPH